MQAIQWIGENYQALLAIVVGLLSVVIAILLLIPGDQGESKIQSIINFFSQFIKPKDPKA